MRQQIVLVLFTLLLPTCTAPAPAPEKEAPQNQSPVQDPLRLTEAMATRLLELPLACIQQEYPNKLNQTVGEKADLAEPSILHPSFYGCFDWHSAVHGHWSVVALLKEFPNLERAEDAKRMLRENLSAANVAREVVYFDGVHNGSYERTYGWAWLLQLRLELNDWEDDLAPELVANLEPLVALIVDKYVAFLPKLNYAIRTGEHPNTAFGMTMAWDYADGVGSEPLKFAVEDAARRFYLNDRACPMSWEPGGFDFLSPCLEEIRIMARVLETEDFHAWLAAFLPALVEPGYDLEVGLVADRTDGKLVHLDGLNFSRAWVLYGLARQYPNEYAHLVGIANKHVEYSLPNLVGDGYEGGHWLGSFALYALR
ncbi:DUF2891 domain-containing protein [Neolewinella antarctica]|uniref:DUF2891 domain-containing protein n=1 Tax=Neolewinella antarctica TaxID=442734 RepID=A0ABX0X873_9BACT|nr:DUF2891 domain-containing protein [Neolewinella antarctica]NJC25433.1 hypothetical protein [Neolewinella antarctica]